MGPWKIVSGYIQAGGAVMGDGLMKSTRVLMI